MEELCRLYAFCCSSRTLCPVFARMYPVDLFRSSADLPRINATQFIGVPLYWLNRDLYYAYMAMTKQSFGIFVATLTQWWAPTPVRVSGDASVAGQIKRTEDGRVELSFPGRVVLIANHQVRKAAMMFSKMLTGADIFRLALFLVGRLYQQSSNARAHIYYPQGISELCTHNWVGDEVLWVRLHVKEDGNGSTQIGIQAAEAEDDALRAVVRHFWS